MLTIRLLFAALAFPAAIQAQEANSGFDLRATLSGMADYSSANQSSKDSSDVGYRAVFYPTWKLSEHWTVTGVYQVNSAYLYPDSAPSSEYRMKGYLLQGSLNYSLVRRDKSLVVRAGQLSTAFGSFMLRYDDAVNPLINPPSPYGYYYAAVSTLGLAAVQADATWGKWDARLQLANSSPSNPRRPFAHDQYGNEAAGAGYTIRQGFRVGVSAYYGPYLDRKSPYFFPGEAPPADLKAGAFGVDTQWARGHWNLQGEWQKFTFPYRAIPTFREQTGYVEAKRSIGPRWYAASRFGYVSSSLGGWSTTLEAAAGYRPAASVLVKLDYQWEYFNQNARQNNIIAMQLVTTVHPLSVAFR